MAIQALYPLTQPSLNLDFANTKKLDPRITFVRASSARYYDGKTVTKAEENLLLRSQEFNDAAWVNVGTTDTANTQVAPDGSTTADTITADAGTALKGIQQNIGLTGTYTYSVFAKAGTHSVIQLLFGGAGAAASAYANFNIAAGSGAVGNTSGTSSIVDAGNGWYRCIFTGDFSSGTSVYVSFVDSTTAARAASTTSTGTIFLWGAQIEQRSSVTAYTPTTTQPITNYIPTLLTATDNVARFDHNSTTGESLGLLVEEQRTNLLERSDDFANAWWSKDNSSITSNTIVAPDGTLTGDKLVEDTASSTHSCRRSSISASATTAYTITVYVKTAERTQFQIQMYGNSGGHTADFNLTSVTATSAGTYGGWTNGSASIQAVGNGWFRLSNTATTNAGLTAFTGNIFLKNNAGVGSYTGDGYSGIYIWGAQLEAGAFPTSYIPTVASQVTRSSETASMTGGNFSSWYRADEGSLYAEGVGKYQPSSLTYPRVLSINDGTNNNSIEIINYGPFNSVGFAIKNNNTIQADLPGTGGTAQSGLLYKVVAAYKYNDIFTTSPGAVFSTDSSAVIPVVNKIDIGSVLNFSQSNGTIRKLAYYPKRLTNAQLQALTA
jgi:hypothetical protein